MSYTTVRRSRISDPESKKARRFVSFQVDAVVAVEVVVVVESWFLWVRVSGSGSSGDLAGVGSGRWVRTWHRACKIRVYGAGGTRSQLRRMGYEWIRQVSAAVNIDG